MMKGTIQSLTHLRDKGDAKIYMVVTTTGEAGEFYSPSGEPSFKVGDEVEFEIEQSSFGPKFKTAKQGGGGFPARKAWTPSQVAQEGATKLTAAALAGGSVNPGDFREFFHDVKVFLIAQIEADNLPI